MSSLILSDFFPPIRYPPLKYLINNNLYMEEMVAFDLKKCARTNILQLQPYRCARDDYQDDGINILLDANENAFGSGIVLPSTTTISDGHGKHESDINISGLNRYPDPHQIQLKKLICNLRNPINEAVLQPENVFVGVGSDEAIDSLLRIFCIPGKSSLLICPPTYGMYNVSACINDVNIVKIPLNQDFSIDLPSITKTLSSDSSINLFYLCSPGNPTAKAIPQTAIEQILAHPSWNGVLVVDEAYIDFAVRTPELTSLPRTNSPWDPPSMAPLVARYPNLVVMGTTSKGHGLAGLRLGFAICPAPIAGLMNALKAPYNISNPTSQLAIRAFQPASLTLTHQHIQQIITQRDHLIAELPRIPGVGRIISGTDANFLLFEILDSTRDQEGYAFTPRRMPGHANTRRPEARVSNTHALAVYEKLAGGKGVVVRFRGREYGCEGCLRVTVGTQVEVDAFLRELELVLRDVLGLDGKGGG